MQFWWLFMLFFFPFIGGVIGLLVQSEKTRQLKLFLAFSGAFLISITILNLIPEVYETLGHKAGYYILGGFFLQIVLDFFTKGIEHGHLHIHDLKKGFPYSVFIALSLHAFIEGLSLGGGAFSEEIQNNMVFAIGLHELPAAFALAVVLKSVFSKTNINYLYIAIYAVMVPSGILIGSSLTGYEEVLTGLIGLVIGVFLHISTTILFENNESHTYGRYKLVAIAIGLGVALLAVNFHIH
ncbi:ZIP family metal transporter [Bacteroidia bacterium]|jgi:zinc and cadmium transporter|nr:ZIP family metal transporter [Bacteroidia bacterium]